MIFRGAGDWPLGIPDASARAGYRRFSCARVSATMPSAGWSIETVIASSGPGSSSVANWLCSSEAGMKWRCAVLHARQQQLVAAVEEDEADVVVAGAQDVPVGVPQRGAGDDAMAARLPPAVDAGRDRSPARACGRRRSAECLASSWRCWRADAGRRPRSSASPDAAPRGRRSVDLPQPETPMKMSAVKGNGTGAASGQGRMAPAQVMVRWAFTAGQVASAQPHRRYGIAGYWA